MSDADIENMKVYKDYNVVEAGYKRMRRIFNEFPNVVLTHSGGKDSTVVFHIALEVAKELDRLPLKVMFIDQEAEWQGTADIIENIMYRDDVEPYWYQIPIKLFNATSYQQDWLYCWHPDKKDIWMREKDPIAIKENNYGCERFANLFRKIPAVEWRDQKTALVGGVRTEESPARFLGMINALTYKDISWGRKHEDKGLDYHYTFYPIYDWSYTDVWKAIHDNNWEYNDVYDKQYQHGVSINDMRVSNLHHTTAVWSLFYMQKVEPETHEKLVRRLPGIDGATKMGEENFYMDDLPFMFSSWKEYRDYLVEKLVDDEHKPEIKKILASYDFRFAVKDEDTKEKIHKREAQAVIANNYLGNKLDGIRLNYDSPKVRKKQDKRLEKMGYSSFNEYYKEEVINNE